MSQKNKSSNHYNKNSYHNRNHNYNQTNYNRKDNDEVKVAREIRDDYPVKEKGYSHKNKKHPIVNFFLFLTLISSLTYFGITLWNGQNTSNFFSSLISSLLLVVFSILFIAICVTNPNRKKGTIFLGSFFLLLFNLFGGLTTLGIVNIPSLGQVEDFTGKSLTDVVKWAEKNKVTLNQDYEYSDMVSEYSIISQDIESGTKTKDINELTVSVSEGPNPDKEIIVPDMDGWNSERVINYVLDNYLNNVDVSFEKSDKAEDTVIEQNKSGSMKRSDELKLTFSLGEELDNSDVKMADLINKSEFEAIFYLKQHRIKYEIEKEFSNKIERGNVADQSVKAGDTVKVDSDDNKVTITISKGKSIKVPDLKKMSMVEITEWVVENKLKLEFTNKYDDSVKENNVISANYDKGDKIEQGSTVKVVISKGNLVMENFKSFDEFKKWADKYDISYEEKHEFSDDVPQGEVISYSYKKGDTIKNGDSIVVTISDGKECKVPDVVDMSKSKAIDVLEEVGLNYNFVTQSSSKSKNTVIKQSISAGSKVSSGTTITITISSGKQTEYRENSSSNHSSSSGSSSSGSSNSGGSSSSGGSGSNPTPTPDPEPEPEPVCNSCYIRPGELKSVILNSSGSFSAASNAVRNFITGRCSGVKVVINNDGGSSGFNPGSYVSGWEGGNFSSCDTITITLAK